MTETLLNLLPAEWRQTALALVATIGVLRLCVKPFGELLKRSITRAIETASNSIDPVDDTWIESLVASMPYRLFAFLLDLVASVKLPAAAELHQTKPPTP